jgi:hypothetical protein
MGLDWKWGILTTETEYVTLIAGLFDAVRWYSKRVKSGKSAMSSKVVWCEVDFGSGGGGVER